MDAILNAPYTVRIMGSLLGILIVNRAIGQLSISVAAGTAILFFWTGQNFEHFISVSGGKLASLANLFLIVAIFQIIILSGQMLRAGIMKDLVRVVKSLVSHRTSLAILPAMIGLLPMPGGALFSAPLVEELDDDRSIDPSVKTLINYWFRHIWEYWWPLYPGMLLAVEISGLPMPVFIGTLFPLTLFSLIGGYCFILRKVPADAAQQESNHPGGSVVLELLLPFFLIIGSYTAVTLLFPAISTISRFLPVIIGVTAAQGYLQVVRPLNVISWKSILFSGRPAMLLLTVACILVYGTLIETPLTDGTLIMSRMKDELVDFGIPIILAIGIIPFISGLTTGLALGFVGASFPLVMSITGHSESYRELLPIVVLAYGCGYIGMMLSPVHLCLVVTNQYFKTSMARVMIHLLGPLLVVFTGVMAMYLVLISFFS